MLGGNTDATEDYEELDSFINEYEVKEIIRSDQENPMVCRTDHEVYFQKVWNEGSMEDFLAQFRFIVNKEFLESVKEYLKGKW